MKSLSAKSRVILAALFFLILAGCGKTMGDLVRSKEEGKGTSRVYKVNVDQAWKIAKRVLRGEVAGEIKENRSEGYMVVKSGSALFLNNTLIGVWIEPIDKFQSKVTVITEPKPSEDTSLEVSETDFHKSFFIYLFMDIKSSGVLKSRPD